MKNPLVWVTVGGFTLSVALLFSAAVIFRDGSLRDSDFMSHWDDRENRSAQDRTIIERELKWDADGEISINAPAEVTYSYSDKPRVTVRGEAYVVNRLEMEDGEVKLNRRARNIKKLEISLSGPAINKFSVNGAAELTLKGLKQDELEVAIAGASEIKADGEVRKVVVSIAGASDVDFSDLKVEDAKVSISGFGDVTIAPRESAEVSIAGAGDVTLLTRPKRLTTHIAGAGNISQPEEAQGTPQSLALPSPPPMPKPPPFPVP
jgi:hypothetical protein